MRIGRESEPIEVPEPAPVEPRREPAPEPAPQPARPVRPEKAPA